MDEKDENGEEECKNGDVVRVETYDILLHYIASENDSEKEERNEGEKGEHEEGEAM